MTDESFTRLLVEAVETSLSEMALELPQEHLSGYAICTDDDASTVFWVATTTEYSDTVDEASERFSAVEWPYGYTSSAFVNVQKEISQKYAATSGTKLFDRHVDACFASFVEALRRVKKAGLFEDDVLIYVTSTDPGPYLEGLAASAVKLLNSAECVRQWEQMYLG